MTKATRRSPRPVSPPPPAPGRRRPWLALLAVVYLALATWYALGTPLGNAPDEAAHLIYIQWLADQPPGSLPVFHPANPGGQYEFHQPPLYYSLAAAAWNATGRPDPQALRFLSILCGLAALLLTFQFTRAVFPDQPGLPYAAAGFAAFLPMHLAGMSSLGNDPLIEALFAAVLLLLVRGMRSGFTDRGAAAIGALIGLALLTKNYGALLPPVAWLALLLAARRDGGWDWPGFFRRAAILTGVALAIGGWWLVRNQLLYGDPLAMRALLEQAHGKGEPTPAMLMAAFDLTWIEYVVAYPLWWTFRSFWGILGEMNVFFPPAVYLALLGVSAAVLVGVVLFMREEWRRFPAWQRRVMWVLGATLLLVLISYIRYNTELFQAQARYLFPALPIFAKDFALGVRRWLPGPAKPWVGVIVPVGMAIFAAMAFGCWVLPAFG